LFLYLTIAGLPHTMPESDKEVQKQVEEVFGFKPCLWQIHCSSEPGSLLWCQGFWKGFWSLFCSRLGHLSIDSHSSFAFAFEQSWAELGARAHPLMWWCECDLSHSNTLVLQDHLFCHNCQQNIFTALQSQFILSFVYHLSFTVYCLLPIIYHLPSTQCLCLRTLRMAFSFFGNYGYYLEKHCEKDARLWSMWCYNQIFLNGSCLNCLNLDIRLRYEELRTLCLDRPK
jgi:hypothetical protein